MAQVAQPVEQPEIEREQAQEQPVFVSPHVIHIRAVAKGLEQVFIPFALFKSDPVADVRQIQAIQAEQAQEKSEEEAQEAREAREAQDANSSIQGLQAIWNSLFTGLRVR